MRADQLTLQPRLRMGYAADARQQRLPDSVRRAVGAILACRTALLGGHVQVCPAGHLARIWDHACRHRMCPPCAWVPIERWLAKQSGRLLAGEQYHVICTMPHERQALWRANVDVMSRLLFGSVHDTVLELFGEATDLGARPGILATRHTWTQTLVLPPHVHCLVTGGGLSADGQWRAVRNGLLWPVRVVMAVFRGQWRAAIRQEWAHGPLALPQGQSPQPVEHRRNRRGRTTWHVPSRERSPHGHGVLGSLGDACDLPPGEQGPLGPPDGSTPALPPAAGGADPPQSRPWGSPKDVTARWDRCPIAIAPEAVAPHAVRGSSNQALKRPAARSGAPRSIGLAAASRLFVRRRQ